VPTILVVDDSATDRGVAGGLLAKDDQNTVAYATNGREALKLVERELPDLVVSDLQMPEMNGLELVEAMRHDFPSIPVVLMTARGSEEIAAEALRVGAAGYVPKVTLGQNLRDTVGRLLADAQADRLHSRLMHALVADSCHFRLQNDPDLFDPLVAHLQELLRCLPLRDEAERLRASNGVRHALWITHIHGNLEIPVTSSADDAALDKLVRERSAEDPYVYRSLDLQAEMSGEQAVFMIRHQGTGIDQNALPENLAAEAADRGWLGRFVLLPSIMDEVSFEDEGRALRLLKRASSFHAEMEIS
jgi:CheY-like chemotaxis protein